jgi:epimerase transport system membrane fusion protein
VEELADAETLLAKGNIAKPRVLALRRAHAGAIGDRGRLLATIARVRQQVIEIEERKLQIRRDRLGAIAAERQATADRIADLRERLPAAEDTLARLDILAPADGTVIGLAVNTAGEVIGPGQTLMEIVPGEADYIVRTAVRPADIDVLAPGLPARVRLTAYSFRSSPPLEGRVVLVSADRFTHPQTGETYFRVDVAIDAASLARLPDVRALPGMQAEVMIETGEQTMAEYLFDPLLAGLETGLREH